MGPSAPPRPRRPDDTKHVCSDDGEAWTNPPKEGNSVRNHTAIPFTSVARSIMATATFPARRPAAAMVPGWGGTCWAAEPPRPSDFSTTKAAFPASAISGEILGNFSPRKNRNCRDTSGAGMERPLCVSAEVRRGQHGQQTLAHGFLRAGTSCVGVPLASAQQPEFGFASLRPRSAARPPAAAIAMRSSAILR